jgi:hypothetical protein
MKIMVNENHFWFNRKTFFNFWKTIPKLNYSFLHTRLISCRNPAMIGRRNLGGTRILPADQILGEYGRNPAMVRSRPDLAKMAGIQPDLAKMVGIRQDLDGFGHWSDRIWPKWLGSGRIWMDSVTDPAGFGQNGRDLAESGWIQPLIRLDLSKMAEIRPLIRSDLDGSGEVWPESDNFGWIRPKVLAGIRQRRQDVAGFWRQLHFLIS